jgi:EmrB/QacA subfamily drug resistance transporter
MHKGEDSGPGPGDGRARWLVLVSVATGTFMANVDATAVTVALPTMAREFDVEIDGLQWVVSAYLLAITAVLPFFGRLADIVGRKRILNLGLTFFILASLFVASAETFWLLIGSRVLQGIGAAMFMATIAPTALATFQQEQRGRILGLIGSIVAAGTLLGPAIGGLLTDAFGWRSIFLINLPVGLLGVIGTCVFLPAEPRRRALIGQLDLPGVFLFGGFTASLLLGLGIGPGSEWSSGKVLCLLAATALFLLLFIGWESRAARPLIDIRLFRRRVFGLGTLAAFLSYILMLFPAFFLPLYLHEVLGWSLGTAGLLMTIQAIAMLLVAPLS